MWVVPAGIIGARIYFDLAQRRPARPVIVTAPPPAVAGAGAEAAGAA